MSKLSEYIKNTIITLFLIIISYGSIGIAAVPDNNLISFGMYSYSPIPVSVNGSAILKSDKTIDLPAVPTYIKQVILSPKTINPFKSIYRSIYTPTFLKQLKSCPFIGVPYELDDNKATQEWVVMTLFYGCIKGFDNYMNAKPHNWILQQDAKKQFRVLMESDGTMISVTKTQSRQKNYDQAITSHYVVNFALTARPQCGVVTLKWVYRQGRYQIMKQLDISPTDCEQLFEYGGNFEMLPEATQNNNRKKAQKAVEAVITPWLKQLQAIH